MNTTFRYAPVLINNAKQSLENEQGGWCHFIRNKCQKIIFAYYCRVERI